MSFRDFLILAAVLLGYLLPKLRRFQSAPAYYKKPSGVDVRRVLPSRRLRTYATDIFHSVYPIGEDKRDDGWERMLSAGGGLTCSHLVTRKYGRTDTTEGPGWMSDSYEGTACANCGAILEEKKVY